MILIEATPTGVRIEAGSREQHFEEAGRLANQPFLTTVLPADYLNPFRFQIGLGILEWRSPGSITRLWECCCSSLYLMVSWTSLKGYFRKGSTGVLLFFTAVYILYTSVLLLVLFTFYFQTALPLERQEADRTCSGSPQSVSSISLLLRLSRPRWFSRLFSWPMS